MVTLPPATFEPFVAFTGYNSPYVAHRDFRAIDLYPGHRRVPSPVAGEVIDLDRVRAPAQPYAPPTDGLVAIDTGVGSPPTIELADGEGAIARLLHVDPSVRVGESVAIGDDLGAGIRAGFFAPWVERHIHLGFRAPGADLRRARGSVPLELPFVPRSVPWDGTGLVVEAAETYTVIDAPNGDGAEWVGLGTDEGLVLDGGLPHYPHGGVFPIDAPGHAEVSVLDTVVGSRTRRSLRWGPVTVRANDTPITGLSLYCARPSHFRVKLITPETTFPVGTRIAVSINRHRAGDSSAV